VINYIGFGFLNYLRELKPRSLFFDIKVSI